MDTELTTIENINNLAPAVIFKQGGIQPILDAIREELMSEVPDLSTAKGRKQVASNAYKASQSKSALEKMRTGLTDQLNSQLKPINGEGRIARDFLDKLRDDIRQPLSDWEEEQEAVIRAKNERREAEQLAKQKDSDHEMALLMDDAFNREAEQLAKQKEQERLAAEDAELKATAEREESIKKEAEDRVRLEAENAAKAELEKAEREKQESIEREKQAEREKIEAQAREKFQAEESERHRLAAEKKAADDKQADEKAAEIAEIEKREANNKHVSDIRKTAKEALMSSCGIDEDTAKKVVLSISNNVIPAVKINY